MESITVKRANEIKAGAEFQDLRDRFIDFLDATPRTVDTYDRALRGFIRYLSEEHISAPTRDTVKAYKDFLLQEHRANTVRLYMTAVRLFFSWLEQENLYSNIAEHIKGVKVPSGHKRDYLTAEQIKGILKRIDRDTPQGRRDYAMFLLMVCNGLRDIETSRADISDLQTLGGKCVLAVQGKGHSDKDTFCNISPEVEEAIRESLRDRQNASESAPLFCSMSNNSNGKRLSTRSISGIIKSILRESGYNSERLSAHSLRHSSVTIALQNGATIQAVSQFARHANISTTMVYSHELDRAENTCNSTITRAVL